MSDLTIYASVGFLQEIFAKMNEPVENFYDDDSHDLIKSIYRLLLSATDLYIDIDILNYVDSKSDRYNPNFKRILKNRKPPKLNSVDFERIRLLDLEFFNNIINPSSVICLCNNEKSLQRIESDFGYIVITVSGLKEKQHLFGTGYESIIKKEKKDWSLLSNKISCCNSLILADQYILSNTDEIDNIKDIALNLLPKSLKMPFDFTIISARDKKGLPKILTIVFNDLTAFFKDNFPYQVNLSIVFEYFHDRVLIGNYFRIQSGHGFHLFEKGYSVKKTSLIISSILQGKINLPDEIPPVSEIVNATAISKSGILNIYFSDRQIFKSLITSSPDRKGLLENAIGTRKNRLTR